MKNSKVILSKGIFTLSLDVELCWGVVDKPAQLDKNKQYYEQSRVCIEKLLELLEKYNISATWAIVGHLFLRECNSNDGQKHSDIPRSVYPWYRSDWFEKSPCSNDREAPLWYGQDIIKSISECSVHQEIACHSFAHIPYGDSNTKLETARADITNCIHAAKKFGIQLRSFVFPRNSVGFVDELGSFGFEAYRGAEPTWYRALPEKLKKVCHILDHLFAASPPVSLPEFNQGLYNIAGSMQYLPMNGFRKAIPLLCRVYKAKKGINKAIKDKRIFHLWFHPFNLATDQEKLFHGLEEIFSEVKSCRAKGELEVETMGGIVDLMETSDD